jgi:hypothetical protein
MWDEQRSWSQSGQETSALMPQTRHFRSPRRIRRPESEKDRGQPESTLRVRERRNCSDVPFGRGAVAPHLAPIGRNLERPTRACARTPFGDPDRTNRYDPLLRRQMLYPIELGACALTLPRAGEGGSNLESAGRESWQMSGINKIGSKIDTKSIKIACSIKIA